MNAAEVIIVGMVALVSFVLGSATTLALTLP
jgi:hypothetical protein